MDKLIYTAASGAQRVMEAQALRANNLANVDSNGFRADLELVQAKQISNTRVLSQMGSAGVSASKGELAPTGRALDLAIFDQGLFAVEANGQEAYTRSGQFELDANGQMRIDGRVAVGVEGPIVVPEHKEIFVGDDGMVSITPAGGGIIEEVGQLKLVNPDFDTLLKGDDGLLRLKDGTVAAMDPEVSLVSGFLESSNVDAVTELVASMDLSRQFEVQIKLMKSAETLAKSGNRLLGNI
ncbi:flagellar basal body rod protein FlgF [Ferrimonas aestuarii]|uniref:Flagellar basal-body rod protein FlgF n=1 Tax=Ferrimonas aestuarii TaxID=2569539 RepID=A0A4V5NW30_9GAMM|nr:flagellar basal body rod protein FlgF [Ferrimonas aestuarii]TKB54582.1 flagellar basal body rod protein FlgF [Ferrimonas aestuarii]